MPPLAARLTPNPIC